MASKNHGVESLVHVCCSFTKPQLRRIEEAGWRGTCREIGVVTYLGSNNYIPENPYLLFRFGRGVYSAPHCTRAFEDAFGTEFEVLYGNEALTSEWRGLVTLPSEGRIKDVAKFLASKARKFAEALTQALVIYDPNGGLSEDRDYEP